MTVLVVCLVALVASGLTLFSGFGLGTLLLPAFALVFPPELAVAATAVVHLANNLFKLALVGRHARRGTVFAFGLPALAGAFLGAFALRALSGLPTWFRYRLFGGEFEVTALKLAIGVLIVLFAWVELRPSGGRERSHAIPLPLGGLGSGFFGGLSGHQGAMRSAILVGSGLTKEAFVATGVWCAVLVDLARLTVYGPAFVAPLLAGESGRPALRLLAAAAACAFSGAWIGVRLLGKVTFAGLRRFVGVLLALVGVALAAGWI